MIHTTLACPIGDSTGLEPATSGSSEIVTGGLIEVVVGGRQAVGTVLFRDRAEQPQGVLAAAAQGDEALAAEHYVSIFEARVGQPEVRTRCGRRWRC